MNIGLWKKLERDLVSLRREEGSANIPRKAQGLLAPKADVISSVLALHIGLPGPIADALLHPARFRRNDRERL
jgi:hypothetical protein